MRRDPALIPLSREHHKFLLLAQLLKKDAPVYKGLPQDLTGKIRYALDIKGQVFSHFDLEERIFALLPESFAAITKELSLEHAKFRSFFEKLSSDTARDACDAFARQFEKHIRTEERVLFEEIQRYGPDILERIKKLTIE